MGKKGIIRLKQSFSTGDDLAFPGSGIFGNICRDIYGCHSEKRGRGYWPLVGTGQSCKYTAVHPHNKM